MCLNFILFYFDNNFDIPEDLDYFPCYLIIVLYVQAWYTRSSTSSARAAGSQGWVWAAWPWKQDPDLQDPHPYHELRAWHSLWASVSFMSQFHRFVSLPFTSLPYSGCVETCQKGKSWQLNSNFLLPVVMLQVSIDFAKACDYHYAKAPWLDLRSWMLQIITWLSMP